MFPSPLNYREAHYAHFSGALWRLGFHLKFDFENANILYLLHGVLVTFFGNNHIVVLILFWLSIM